jgi:Protein of unknown function (DUF4231)
MSASEVTLERLEDQIAWYDGKSAYNQSRFKTIKIVGLAAAAIIPVLSGLQSHATFLMGTLGALVVALEGIQQLNQYHANWIAYRSTAEALKHEKFLYLAQAAHYRSVTAPEALLAERIESLVSQEHAKWATSQQPADPAKVAAK